MLSWNLRARIESTAPGWSAPSLFTCRNEQRIVLPVRLLRRRLKLLLQPFRDQKQSLVSMRGTPLYNQYRQAYQAYRNLKRRLEKALLFEVKEKYEKEQPVIDIQRQLNGLSVAEQENLRVVDFVFAERVQAIDTLFTLPHHPRRRSANGGQQLLIH